MCSCVNPSCPVSKQPFNGTSNCHAELILRQQALAASMYSMNQSFTLEMSSQHQASTSSLVLPVQVGTGYFDEVSTVISAGASSTLALKGSTESSQFH